VFQQVFHQQSLAQASPDAQRALAEHMTRIGSNIA
jgi:hypothetical protein